MNEIVENDDGTYSMRIQVDGVEQLRRCEAVLPGRYLDGRPNYNPVAFRPEVFDGELLIEAIGCEMHIVKSRE